MEDEELTITKVVLRRGLDSSEVHNFDMNGSSGFKRGGVPSEAALLSEGLNNFSWEGTMPVLARRLANSLPDASGPAEFAITELRGIPQTGLDHFVLAKSCNGKPLYGAYVRSPRGELCLQQLFEFSQTAFNAGLFLPIPTVGAHFAGDYGLDYARLQFCGSIKDLPEILRLPASPTSGFDSHPPSCGVCAFAEGPPATLDAEVSNNGEPLDSQDSFLNSATTEELSGGTQNPRVVSSMVAPYNDCMSSYQESQEDVSDGHPISPPPSTLTSRGTPEEESPTKSVSEPSLQQAQQPVATASSAEDASASTASERILPALCLPWALCVLCSLFWGMAGLPERHFETAVVGAPEANVPAILSSEKTAARKRKSTQSRHGPKSKTSEYRGVNLYQRTGKWEAHIWCDSEQLYLGASSTKVHAAEVYDKAALFLFGPYAETNFPPERYQEEYDFMQRLTRGQMLAYLRRESRENGEEVRYPGVAKIKTNLFAASYRPRKEKKSQEDIGIFKTEEEAVRAVLKEAKRRKNYELAAKLLDIQHLRSVRPATGKIKRKRKSRTAHISAAFRVGGSRKSRRTSPRAHRVAANINSARRNQAAPLPAPYVAIAPLKLPNAKKTVKPNPSSAPKGRNAAISESTAALRSEEPGSSTPPPVMRTYVRKNLKAQRTIIPKEIISAATVAEKSEGPPRENARASGKRKVRDQPKTCPSAAKRARGRAPITRLLLATAGEGESSKSPAPLRRTRPRRCNSTPDNSLASRPLTMMPPPAALTGADIAPIPVAPMATAPPATPAPVPTSWVRPVSPPPPPRTHQFMSLSSDLDRPARTPAFPSGRQFATLGSWNSQTSRMQYCSGLVKQRFEEQTRVEAVRQFQETCDWLLTQRPDWLDIPMPTEPNFAKSTGVIRPVARRLVLAIGTGQPGEGSCAAGSGAPRNPPGPARDWQTDCYRTCCGLTYR